VSKVLVGIGSNIHPEQHLIQAFDSLDQAFADLRLSPVYRCQAVGFDGDDFLNLVASFVTDLGVGELQQKLKAIEASTGRTGQEAKWSGRTLDIDILTYDHCVGEIEGVLLPRDEIIKHAYVLQPLADLEPDAQHPELGVTYADLWSDFEGERHLQTESFRWRGEIL